MANDTIGRDIFSEHRDYLYQRAYSLCRNREDAEELVQDCLLRAYDNLSSYKVYMPLRAWLETILRNRHVDVQRRQRIRPLSTDAPLQHEPSRDDVYTLGSPIGDKVDALTGTTHTIVTMTADGYTREEIGQYLQMSPGSVASKLHRTRLKLRCP